MSWLTPRVFAKTLAVSAVLGVLSGAQFWLNATLEGFGPDLPAVLARHVPSWWTWGLAAPFILHATERWPVRGAAWRRGLSRHVSIALLFALAHRPFHVWFAWFPFWGRGDALAFVRDFSFFSLFTDVALYWGLVAAKTVYDQRTQLHTRDLLTLRLESELSAAKLAALEQQLRPHFLFNTLQALQTLLAEERTEEARDLVAHLSDLLRSVLDEDTPSEVSLREELELAAPYLALMSVRFGARLKVSSDVSAEAADARVPRLILQPLLENAFLHGVEGRRGAGRVAIEARVEARQLVLEVHDNGPGPLASERRGGGLGLANVRGRLDAQYGPRAQCSLMPRQGGGTRARIEIPWRVELFELEGAS